MSKYYDIPFNLKDPNSIPWQYFILTRRREKMPNSLKCKIKHLCHNRTITESECDRILKALEKETVEKDCRINMTNYDYIISKMTPQKLAGIYSEMHSCKKCPKRETYKHCFMAGNFEKKCSAILLDWLMQQHYEE